MSNRDFLQGLVAGVVAGLGLAILLRTDTAQDMLASLQQSPSRRPYEWNSEYSQGTDKESLQRQRAEAGGNPASLAPEKSSDSSTPFERPAGAPGTPAGPESINVPGRPGKSSDLSDPARSVRPASRAVHVKDSKTPPPESPNLES